MRDIQDCLVKAFLRTYPEEDYLESSEFLKCWDFSKCEKDSDKPIPTQYLLDKQKEGKYLCTKVDTDNWRPQDLYEIDLLKLDPMAVCQNLGCEIEKMMGIFPNIPK